MAASRMARCIFAFMITVGSKSGSAAPHRTQRAAPYRIVPRRTTLHRTVLHRIAPQPGSHQSDLKRALLAVFNTPAVQGVERDDASDDVACSIWQEKRANKVFISHLHDAAEHERVSCTNT